MPKDKFTDLVNTGNQTKWFNEASEKGCRLALTMGINPDGSVTMLLAQQMPPGEIVRILKQAAEALESQSTGKIIVRGINA